MSGVHRSWMGRAIWLLVCVACVLLLALPLQAVGSTPERVGSYIVVLEDSALSPAEIAEEHRAAFGLDVEFVYSNALSGYAARVPEGRLAALERDRSVSFVAENGTFTIADHCRDLILGGGQCVPEGVDRLDGERSSTRSGDGRRSVAVNVAVLDTGVDGSHEDLNVVPGVNCVDNLAADYDPYGHGSHVGGTIGALDDDFGVVGVAPGAPLWSVRVLNRQGVGSSAQIICGIDWVTGTRTDQDPSNDILVANMSLQDRARFDEDCGSIRHDAVHLAICNSVASGVTYVVAAGNDGGDIADTIPAAYDEVLAVTAMADSDGQPGGEGPEFSCSSGGNQTDDSYATFSNFATLAADRAHTLAAPGVCIWSTYSQARGFRYAIGSGTSFAAPHVTGAVALCISSGECADMTPAEIIQRFVADAADYNTSRRGSGFGFIGDPIHQPQSDMYFGYLIRASEY